MSNPIQDGGPAFPISRAHFSPEGKMLNVDWMPGMSLRDWFAGQALAGEIDVNRIKDGGDIVAAAELAYLLADAMITARKAK